MRLASTTASGKRCDLLENRIGAKSAVLSNVVRNDCHQRVLSIQICSENGNTMDETLPNSIRERCELFHVGNTDRRRDDFYCVDSLHHIKDALELIVRHATRCVADFFL